MVRIVKMPQKINGIGSLLKAMVPIVTNTICWSGVIGVAGLVLYSLGC